MSSLQEVKLIISSILVSNPLETSIKACRKYYLDEIGEEIPFRKFGFSSLEEFLRSLPEILEVQGSGNNATLSVVVSKKVAHLDKLIQKQRVTVKYDDQPSRRHADPIQTHKSRSRSSSVHGSRIRHYENERSSSGRIKSSSRSLSTSASVRFLNDNYDKNASVEYKTKYPHNVLRFDESIPKLMVSEIVRCPDGIQVNIGSVYDPSKFYIILNENFQALDEMMDDMQQAYAKQNRALRIDEQDLKKGIFCVSVYNGEYHRGLVKKIIREKRKANIFFVDYGIMDAVDTNEIYFLKKIFAKFPQQAIRAKLSEIHPLIPGTPWSIEARDCFIDLVNSKVLNVEKCKLDEKHQVLEFFMLDYSNGGRIFVNKKLVELKVAERNTLGSGDDVCTSPSFEEIEEDLTTPPLAQKDIMGQWKSSQRKVAEVVTETCRKDQFVLRTRLFEQTVHVVYIRNKFYITMYDMMHLARLQNSSIMHIWKKITELRGGQYKCSFSMKEDPKIYYDLHSYGLSTTKNEIYSLISVDFIPYFFRYFSDVILPRALYEDFLDELHSYIRK